MTDEEIYPEPPRVEGKHRFMAGTCVDCGHPLDEVCTANLNMPAPTDEAAWRERLKAAELNAAKVGNAVAAGLLAQIDTKDARIAELEKALRDARQITDEQAEDAFLWFMPQYITEDALQCALRRLHAAIEGKTPEECARAALEAAK